MNNAVFTKTMENIRKHRNINLLVTNNIKIYIVSESTYHTTKYFLEHLLAIETLQIKNKMNQSAYLGLSILETGKPLTHDFWYDYIQPKYQKNAKLCYMDTFKTVHIKIKYVCKDIANDVEKRFDTSSFKIRNLMK